MKNLAAFILLLAFIIASITPATLADSRITLAWTPSLSVHEDQRLYVWTNNPANGANPASVFSIGTTNQWQVTFLQPGVYWFAVSCVASNVESDLSNILPVMVPYSPTNLATVAVESSVTITGPWTTNIFLKLKPLQ